jgi:PEP-CTERM motif-containing protein
LPWEFSSGLGRFSPNLAIPGWSASGVIYDQGSLGGSRITINDSKTTVYGFWPLQGRFSVILFAGPDSPNNATSISQTGLVPANSQSILMDVALPSSYPFAGTFEVTVGGQQITMEPLQTGSVFTLYGGKVSEFAGQVEGLTITQFPPLPPTVPPSAIALDDIVFSPNSIPEPATWALMLCGMGVFAFRRGKHKR